MTYTWNDQELYSINTRIDCGEISVKFFNEGPEQSTLDPRLYSQTVSPNAFIVLQTQDVGLKGEYRIKYELKLVKYPNISAIIEQPFVITVIDPCDNPLDLAVD